jgi:hypothetical protein
VITAERDVLFADGHVEGPGTWFATLDEWKAYDEPKERRRQGKPAA